MKEYTFRAWDKYKKKMIYDICFINGKFELYKTCDNTSFCGNQEYGFSIERTLNDVMQYTGLKDINGKEIYEGDIVGFYNENDFDLSYLKYNLFKVVYKDCNFIATDITEFANYWLGSKGIKNIEVLGNIYENLELLLNKDNKK